MNSVKMPERKLSRRRLLSLGAYGAMAVLSGGSQSAAGEGKDQPTSPRGRKESALQKVPILCYHRVHSDDDPDTPPIRPGTYCGHVTRSVFQWQMEQLAKRGFSTITRPQLYAWLTGKAKLPAAKVVAIDFDDNRLNVMENAVPIMKRYGFTGTAFTISSWADGRESEDMKVFPVMGWRELAKLVKLGWTIGAHTVNHPDLAKLSKKENGLKLVEQEMSGCNEEIRRHLGITPLDFTYPDGLWNEDVEKVARRYYRTIRHWSTTDTPMNTAATAPYRLQAINISMLMDKKTFLGILDKASGLSSGSQNR